MDILAGFNQFGNSNELCATALSPEEHSAAPQFDFSKCSADKRYGGFPVVKKAIRQDGIKVLFDVALSKLMRGYLPEEAIKQADKNVFSSYGFKVEINPPKGLFGEYELILFKNMARIKDIKFDVKPPKYKFTQRLEMAA